MYNWSVDEKKFKKGNPKEYKIWLRYKSNVQKVVDLLSQNKRVKGGQVYLRRKQRINFFNDAPVTISVDLDKSISKYEYVFLGFSLDEEISPEISVIDQNKKPSILNRHRLVSEFGQWK